MTRWWTAGAAFATFVVSQVALRPFIPATTCRDGWHSPSIGHRGACSWHGGVGDNGWAFLAYIAGGVLAFVVWVWLERRIFRQEQAEAEREKSAHGVRPIQAHLDAHRHSTLSPNGTKPASVPPLEEILARRHGIDCPECKSALVVRLARSGRNKGKHFLGCSTFPHCFGKRRIAEDKLEYYFGQMRRYREDLVRAREKIKSDP